MYMLSVKQLECIRGTKTLFRNVSFELNQGQVLRVEGANGSGKTSLMRIVCGLLKPAGGEVRWKNSPLSALGTDYYADAAYLGHTNGLKDELSALENLCLASELNACTPSEAMAFELLKQVGLLGRERLPTKVLSQGQKRRVALARIKLIPKSLWLLDEPLAALDNQAIGFVEDMLSHHLANGGSAILTTHQPINTPVSNTIYLQLNNTLTTG
jgi:heme exporter protein A